MTWRYGCYTSPDMPTANTDQPSIPVVILCGGLGTRLKEETEFKPKPLVEVGGKPILWHIMKLYSHHGFKRFILCLGYKGDKIKEYFVNYEFMNSDFTLELGNTKDRLQFHNSHLETGWQITFLQTGEKNMTGSRVMQVEKFIDADRFMLTYGDGIANVDVQRLLAFHLSHGKIATITGVRPPSRFGELVLQGSQVKEFREKSQVSAGLINGGFFIFERSLFDYLDETPDCILEKTPLERLAREGQLMAYVHEDFWQCMDTYRDYQLLNHLWESQPCPWKVWKD